MAQSSPQAAGWSFWGPHIHPQWSLADLTLILSALEDVEETHHRLSFMSRWALEHAATNIGEDLPDLELALQEQWRDMVESLEVIEEKEAPEIEMD
ncbi:hypothetical protein C0992_001268 [Termitomyces sp. T32_za158]|nr:hypothetical protein C0992_001268 [Termitomyces sp. T32_za158]